MSFENIYNVYSVENKHAVRCFCPLGQDNYTANITVTVTNPKLLVDYLDSDSFISSLNGQELIIEDLASRIAEYFKKETQALDVVVTAYVEDATHSPVEVTVTL